MSERHETVRLDKWLWAARFFKTRSLATEACQADHVKVGRHPAKPSRPLRVGDEVQIRYPGITRTIRVSGLSDKRVGAKQADGLREDVTPEDELRRYEEWKRSGLAIRLKGQGRPTKKERRTIDRFRWDG